MILHVSDLIEQIEHWNTWRKNEKGKNGQFWCYHIWRVLNSVQFSSVAQLCPTICDPMHRSTPGLPFHHRLPEFTQIHAHQVGDAIQPSLLCRPLLLLQKNISPHLMQYAKLISCIISLGSPGDTVVNNLPANVGDKVLIPGFRRSPGGVNGNPLQHSCLKKSHRQRSLVGYSPWGCRVGHDWATEHIIDLKKI